MYLKRLSVRDKEILVYRKPKMMIRKEFNLLTLEDTYRQRGPA